ncbi:DUF1801 domain-containing protein ['Paenibacillus yunnanensis' Narsing Rao et al. 2020]|uniref:DUF1801 domain-containing protein n=1 Tax=Paenibacillus tengchongensis TaxID=2608684 RepID=UPI00124BE505|nr:DUF1801 domain-containing protein [Paenibacillus tengchongensis]
MKYEANTPEQYIDGLPQERKAAVAKMRETIRENLPEGFAETIGSGMIAFVVPHSLYPAGYHVNPAQPLPFISIASQKNYIALYHMGLYMNPELLDWFKTRYAEEVPGKLDMGKSCIRFKKAAAIPYPLIAELSRRITVQDYIACYERSR